MTLVSIYTYLTQRQIKINKIYEIERTILIRADIDGIPKKYSEIRDEVFSKYNKISYDYNEIGWNNKDLHFLVGEYSYYQIFLLK